MHDFILNALIEMAKRYSKEEVGLQVLLWSEKAELTSEDVKKVIQAYNDAEYERKIKQGIM